MRIETDLGELSEATREVLSLPGSFDRARKSATAALANEYRQRLRDHVETGGSGSWEAVHPLTAKYYKGRGGSSESASPWRVHRRKGGPFEWLGKFARYKVEEDGTATIRFGKSHRGEKGSFDPFLMSVVERAEEGERTAVTDKMRRFFGTTRRGFKNPALGSTFFPLSKDTDELVTPERPIFVPVARSMEGKAMPFFEMKFWGAVTRYQEEASA